MYFALTKEVKQRQSPLFLELVELLLVQDPIAQQMIVTAGSPCRSVSLSVSFLQSLSYFSVPLIL